MVSLPPDRYLNVLVVDLAKTSGFRMVSVRTNFEHCGLTWTEYIREILQAFSKTTQNLPEIAFVLKTLYWTVAALL